MTPSFIDVNKEVAATKRENRIARVLRYLN